jgi:hypothetical protein
MKYEGKISYRLRDKAWAGMECSYKQYLKYCEKQGIKPTTGEGVYPLFHWKDQVVEFVVSAKSVDEAAAKIFDHKEAKKLLGKKPQGGYLPLYSDEKSKLYHIDVDSPEVGWHTYLTVVQLAGATENRLIHID